MHTVDFMGFSTHLLGQSQNETYIDQIDGDIQNMNLGDSQGVITLKKNEFKKLIEILKYQNNCLKYGK